MFRSASGIRFRPATTAPAFPCASDTHLNAVLPDNVGMCDANVSRALFVMNLYVLEATRVWQETKILYS